MALAVGVLSITILAVGLLSLTITRSAAESNDRISSVAVCNTILDQVVEEAKSDPDFWALEHLGPPYRTGTVKMAGLEYEYDVTAETVLDASGDPIGKDLPNNRLKRVVITLTWFDTKNNERQGYGELKEVVSRLVNQNP